MKDGLPIRVSFVLTPLRIEEIRRGSQAAEVTENTVANHFLAYGAAVHHVLHTGGELIARWPDGREETMTVRQRGPEII